MANTTIQLKKSSTTLTAPGSLANGELAINYADGILYYKASNGSIASIQSQVPNFGIVNANGSLLVSGVVKDVLTIASGTNITITPDILNNKLTISASGGTSDLTPANNWANTKLSNTSGVWFSGNLNISNDLYISNNITNVTSIIFNTSTNRTPTSPGELTWSQDDSTLHFDMDSPSNVIGHIGQDLFYYVKNQTGSTINKGTVVRFAGTLGASGRLLIAPAIANNSYPSKYVMGVTAASIADAADGFVISQGKIRGIDTSMFSEGDILYVSSSTPGAFSNTMPSAPNNKITVAAVIKSDVTQGSIEVRVTLGSKLNEDELAEFGTLTNGDVLQYVSANGRFENKQTLVNAYGMANAAFDKANAANVLAFNTGIGANAYTVTVGAASNNYANLSFYTIANGSSAFDKANAANVLAKAAYDYANTLSGQKFTEANTKPGTPATGDEWLDSANGILYTYVADTNSSQWVELGPALTVAPTLNYNIDGGTPSTVYGGISTIDAGGVT